MLPIQRGAYLLLLPANEVREMVMILHMSVILSMGEGGWLPSMHHKSHDQHQGGLASQRASQVT